MADYAFAGLYRSWPNTWTECPRCWKKGHIEMAQEFLESTPQGERFRHTDRCACGHAWSHEATADRVGVALSDWEQAHAEHEARIEREAEDRQRAEDDHATQWASYYP